MKDQILKAFSSLKEAWGKLAPKIQKLIIAGTAALLVVAIAATILLNSVANQMAILFPRLSAAETTAVCSALSEMGVTAEINGNGEIMVPEGMQGELQVQLAGRGFPQSAPTYDIYLDNTGFTRTESEKRQILVYQLQENIRASLMQSKGVKNAVVLLTVPEDTGYVWDKARTEGSASVTMTMENGFELSPERVSAIKNLVAFSVLPQMSPQNVKVIDASTGIEMLSTEEGGKTSNGLDFERFEFEARIQKNMEDNVRRLLSPMYGAQGVTVVASVKLDYDKMLTEQHELVPEANGNGVKVNERVEYELDGNYPASGLVGEENNTDVPIYPNENGDGGEATTNYYRDTEWATSYINTQIEKGEAILKEATISVAVDDYDFTQQKKDSLVEMVSKAVNLPPEAISVQNYSLGMPPQQTDAPVTVPAIDPIILLAGGGIALILIVIIVVLVVMRRRKKAASQKTAAMLAEEEEAERRRVEQEEIEQHKRDLAKNAQSQEDSKEAAIANEIRKFSHENPEITAHLIRSMLKEDA